MAALPGTIFIVDDVKDICTALARLLRTAHHRVRTFDSAEQFLEEQDAEEPGCLILDICLPGLNGIELQQSLARSASERPIIFLTGLSDIQCGVSAMKGGAVDFLTKPIDNQKLFAAVDEALRRDAVTRADRAVSREIEQRAEQLTRREMQVLVGIVHGNLNKQIASQCGIHEKTVKVHRARVMEKMGVRCVPHLIRLAERVGISVEPALGEKARTFAWKSTAQDQLASIGG